MKKKILLIFLLVLSVFTLQINTVNAKELPGFYANDNLTLEKDVDATLFAAGETVNVKSNVNGSSFIAGKDVKVSSNQDILFTAGQDVELNEVVTKDAFVAGETIKIDNSQIRDLFVAARKITINSDIERNAFIGGESVIINSTISGNAYVAADNITIEDGAKILGTLKYPEEAKITISDSAVVEKTSKYKSTTTVEIEKPSVESIIAAKISSFLSLLLIGVILMAIYKKLFERVENLKLDAEEFIKRTFTGLGILVGLPLASIILMCTVIGLPLSLILLVLYFVFIYLSAIPTAYYIGSKLLKDKVENKYLVLTISLACIYILKLIPVIGGLVGFITLCLGLGLTLVVLKPSKK